MLGWIICREGAMPRRLLPEVRTVCGVAFVTLETAAPRHRWERRRLRRAVEAMVRQGVRRAVVQGELPQELLTGLRLVDRSTLRRALLPKLLDWAQESWQLPLERSAVRLRARQTDAEAVRAACLLARRARYVALDTGPGQELLAAELQRRFGLGQRSAGPVMLEVCLNDERRGGAPVLYLGEEGTPRQRLELTAPQLPHGEETLFSAIFQAGKLAISDIEIKFVEFCA